MAKAPTATNSISHWGPNGTSGLTPQLSSESVLLREANQASGEIA